MLSERSLTEKSPYSMTPFMCNSREGNGIPLQYSCLENPKDGGAWWAAVHGVAKSQTRLSAFTFTVFVLLLLCPPCHPVIEPLCPPHQPTSSSYLEDKHLPSKHGHGVKVPITDVGPVGGIFGLIRDGRPGGGPGLRGHLGGES